MEATPQVVGGMSRWSRVSPRTELKPVDTDRESESIERGTPVANERRMPKGKSSTMGRKPPQRGILAQSSGSDGFGHPDGDNRGVHRIWTWIATLRRLDAFDAIRGPENAVG
jgi:hypothetical protein